MSKSAAASRGLREAVALLTGVGRRSLTRTLPYLVRREKCRHRVVSEADGYRVVTRDDNV